MLKAPDLHGLLPAACKMGARAISEREWKYVCVGLPSEGRGSSALSSFSRRASWIIRA